MMRARLDASATRILGSLHGNPKMASEVSRLQGIPVTTVWEQVRWLQDLGLVHDVLTFVDSSGEIRRYFEGVLPEGTTAEEVDVEL